jgi:ribose-phosphate pyrophosphokinase
MISVAGADRLLSMDLHCAQIEGFFNIPVDHLLGVPIITPYFRDKYQNRENLMIVSPDLGSVTRARNFAARLDVPLAIVDKRRQKANVSEVMNIIGDVRDKDVIIVDDMIDTAGTLCNAARAIIEIGGAASVSACATHGVLSGPAIERIESSPLKEVVLLDTVPLAPEKKTPKITVLPVAPVISQAIQRIYADTPVSPLFNVY